MNARTQLRVITTLTAPTLLDHSSAHVSQVMLEMDTRLAMVYFMTFILPFLSPLFKYNSITTSLGSTGICGVGLFHATRCILLLAGLTQDT